MTFLHKLQLCANHASPLRIHNFSSPSTLDYSSDTFAHLVHIYHPQGCKTKAVLYPRDVAKEAESALGGHWGKFLLFGHSPNGSMSFLLSNGQPKDDSEAMHHKTLQAIKLWFMEDQTLQVIQKGWQYNSIENAELSVSFYLALVTENTVQGTKALDALLIVLYLSCTMLPRYCKLDTTSKVSSSGNRSIDTGFG